MKDAKPKLHHCLLAAQERLDGLGHHAGANAVRMLSMLLAEPDAHHNSVPLAFDLQGLNVTNDPARGEGLPLLSKEVSNAYNVLNKLSNPDDGIATNAVQAAYFLLKGQLSEPVISDFALSGVTLQEAATAVAPMRNRS